MKNKKSLFLFIFAFGSLLFQLQAQTDSLSVKPLSIPPDSIPVSYEWTARSPLSTEEQQRREDNRAEVEEMKRRFRQFHKGALDKETNTAEDQNYLWQETDNNSPDKVKPSIQKPSSATDTEELRREINRNFQQQPIPDKAVPPPSASPSPVEPDNIILEWQNETPPASTVDWQLSLGQNQSLTEKKLSVNQVFTLEGVQFEDQSAELSLTTKNILFEWLALFQQNPGMKIEIRSHTHQGIPYTEALTLSVRRARAINAYFISLGIPEKQLFFKGYGRLLPLFSSLDEDNQQKNERIEVIILELPDR